MTARKGILIGVLAMALVVAGSTPAAASARHLSSKPIVRVGANKSNNWSGYNQGLIEQGGKRFQSITGSWTVPVARPHKAGENEYSSTWIGIGGGCVTADCLVTDSTLIQDGTEQDVDAAGKASYYAWWEIIPAPGVQLSGCTPDASCTVGAGDHMSSSISSPADGLWTMALSNSTRGWTWSMAIGYSSTEGSAEWIEETPVVVDNSGNVSIGPMPDLSGATFDGATTNGAPANLNTTEQIQLVDANGAAIATPSNPDPDADGFNACTYSGSCGAPASS
jgi:hypothetical protein